MSHFATNWAFEQSGLKPAAKLVLLALADCHNPVHGCFPSHEYIARICSISERSVRDQLDTLEAAGYIRRVKTNTGSGRASNHYILGFDLTEEHPTADFADGDADDAQRQKATTPAANSDTAQRQYLPTNPVREPLTKPVNARACSFSQFWEVWPNRNAKARAEKAWKKLNPSQRQEAIESAKDWYAAWRKQYPTASDMLPASYLNGRRWEDEGWQKTGAVDSAKRAAMIEEMKASPVPAIREQARRMEAAGC